MTLSELEEELVKSLQQIGIEVPRLESKWIIEKVGIVRQDQEVSLNKQKQVWSFFDRRSKGEPLAYILEERGFYKETFFVKEGVLIPRPETEILVEQVLDWTKKSFIENSMIFDLGCGSGCIGLSLLKELPATRLKAFDKSSTAIDVTLKNSKDLNLQDRSEIILRPVEEISTEEFGYADIVVSNPPYIADRDPEVWRNVHQFEPKIALYSGPTGLEKIESWSKKAFDLLAPGGFFAMEFGKGQDLQVIKILQDLCFKEIRVIKDLAGIDRIITAQKENL